MKLNLTRPIVFFDLETTGLQVGNAHIVQLCFLKMNPDGSREVLTRLVRPVDSTGHTISIPAETTAVHGITDQMVAHEPSFKQQAEEFLSFIGEADLAGYNSNKFDVPLLVEEFLRAGFPFSLKERRLVDVQNIFHKMEQRTLKAAYKFYCGKELENAHSADADTMATYEVLVAQIERYAGIDYEDRNGKVSQPVVNDISALSQFSSNAQWADLVGHIGFDSQHHEVFNFGKHKGERLVDIFTKEPSYYDWIMKAEFPLSTKQVVEEVMDRMKKDKIEQLKMKFEGKASKK